MTIAFDVIGDVHGELPALAALGRELGYRVDDGWSHPDGRMPFFLGDLVDRGAFSLEVAELVKDLWDARRAFCIMGNHEYNLVAWRARVPGYERPKRSNKSTTEDIDRRPERWRRVLEFMRRLPLAVELPDLRLIHACWHRPSLDEVRGALSVTGGGGASASDGFGSLERHVTLRSPFDVGTPLEQTRLLAGLPGDTSDKSADIPHENLIKGYEADAPEPFTDNDGKPRTRIRAMWWRPEHAAEVLRDRPQVFGHYWNLPPVTGATVPPHPSGHHALRAWARSLVGKVPDRGRRRLENDVACIDFHGVTNASARACVGALRWPEREIVWATAAKTAADSAACD